MTGSLPSAAGPSGASASYQYGLVNIENTAPSQSIVQDTSQGQPYVANYTPTHFGHPSPAGTFTPTSETPMNTAYVGTTWQHLWNHTPHIPYPSGVPSYSRQTAHSQLPFVQFQNHMAQPPNMLAYPPNAESAKQRSPSPSPPPLPQYPRHWDAALKSFLTRLGLTQTLHGFESDMLVMNDDWERSKVPAAVEDLVKDLSRLGEQDGQNNEGSESKEHSLDDRKLDYVHFSSGIEPRSQTSINKSISRFLAQSRARNGTSNRAEFLYSLAQKRKHLDEDDVPSDPTPSATDLPSCARVDAKPIDRGAQMKYDIAKNEEGPLRKTVKSQMSKTEADGKTKGKQKAVDMDENEDWLTARHPGLEGRLADIETHLSVRYVPSPPRTLLSRLKFLEDHIVRLEKDYPPWAALHFNQPNRGWPPPPRSTPIIVPPHLRAPSAPEATSQQQQASPIAHSLSPPTSVTVPLPGGGRTRNSTSSLHRAVLEKLEVQKAMSDLAGRGDG